MPKKKSVTPVYTIPNPEDAAAAAATSPIAGSGYADLVRYSGRWYVLKNYCSPGYVPPTGSGYPAPDGSVVRLACVLPS